MHTSRSCRSATRIRDRIAALYDFEKTGVPFSQGGRYFYTSNSGHQDQSVLLMAPAADAAAVVALDPNGLPPAGHPVVTGYVPSHDGRLMAYGVSLSGSDWTEWRIRDLESGADLPDVLAHTKYYPPVFSRDGKGLYYGAFPAPAAGAELSTRDSGHAVYFHELGTPATHDRRVLGDAAHPDWQYEPHLTPDGRWLVVVSGEGEVGDKGREDVYVVELASGHVSAMASGFAAAYTYVGAAGGRLYFLTSLEAPNGRVIAVDPQQPAAAWRTVIPQGRDAIEFAGRSVTLVGHRLLVRSLHDAHSRVVSYALDGSGAREIELPGAGTAVGFDGRGRRPGDLLRLQRPRHAADGVPLRRGRRAQQRVARAARRLRSGRVRAAAGVLPRQGRHAHPDAARLPPGPQPARQQPGAAVRLRRLRHLEPAGVQPGAHRLAGDGRRVRARQHPRRRRVRRGLAPAGHPHRTSRWCSTTSSPPPST